MNRGLVYKELRELWVPAAIYVAIAVALRACAREGISGPGEVADLYIFGGLLIAAVAAGGHTMARERAHGTEAFLHSLPLSRARMLLVKVIAAGALLAVVYLVVAPLGLLTREANPTEHGGYLWQWRPALVEVMPYHLAGAVALYFAGCLFSSVTKSTLNAAFAGCILFVALFLGWYAVIGRDPLIPYEAYIGVLTWNLPARAAIGLVLMLGGAALVASYLAFSRTPMLEGGRRALRAYALAPPLVIAAGVLFLIGAYWFGEPAVSDIQSIRRAHLSPDRERIVLECATRFADDQLWLMDADGSNATNITRAKSIDPLWLADSRHVLFTYQLAVDPEGYRKVECLADTRTGGIMQIRGYQWFDRPADSYPLSCSLEHDPRLISPSGRYVVLGQKGEAQLVDEYRIVQVRPEIRATDVTWDHHALFLGWRPNEGSVVISRTPDTIVEIPFPAGTPLYLVTTGPAVEHDHVRSIQISPDTRWIAWVTSTDQYEPKNVTTYLKNTETGAWVKMRGQPMKNGWSPNARFLWTFMRRKTPQGHPMVEIRLVDLSSGRIVVPEFMHRVREWGLYAERLPEYEKYLAWDRQRSRAVLQAYLYEPGSQVGRNGDEAQAVLMVTDADGSNPIALRSTDYSGFGFAEYFRIGGWSADGKIIGIADYPRNRDLDGGRVIIVDPRSGDERVLLDVGSQEEEPR